MKLNIFIAVLLLLLADLVSAQSYYFRHYQVENGLSNNATICGLQDKKGFLWFGTKDGLNRFDGYSFKVFRTAQEDTNSIGSNFIHCLYEDPNGILWVGTENGLYRYDGMTESFRLLKGSENGPIRDVRMDGVGSLWFIWGFTLTRYQERTHQLRQFPINDYFEATSICSSSDGIIWAATPTGLLKKYNPVKNAFDSFDLFDHSPPPVSRWIERVYATSNNQIMVGTSNQGAKVFDLKTSKYIDILTYNTNKIEIFVRNFVQTSEDECWIGTESGIYIFNLATGKSINLQKQYNDPYSISDNAVYCFVKDKEGSIWAGTYFGGINFYPKPNTYFKKYFPKINENSLSGNVVREIHQDQRGNLWIGTEDAGLNKLDTSTKQVTHFEPRGDHQSISSTNIHGLYIDNNELWLGTFENGMDVLNINTGKVQRHYSMGAGEHDLKSNFIYHISKLRSGEIVIGTTRGAYVYNRNTNNFSQLAGMPQNNWYTYILHDRNNIVWASTYGNGVNFYNSTTGASGNFRYDKNNKNSLPGDRVNTIFQDNKNQLWFATENGLCRFNPLTKTFKTYTTRDGLPSDFILSLLEDSKHNLWISTSRGLVCFNPVTEKSIIYTRANGLLSDQFNFNAAYQDSTGRMYFGSVKGMISFHPQEFPRDDFVPPVYITGFQIFNKELSVADKGSPLKKSITNTNEIVLLYNQSTFSIDFASLSYIAPEMSEYAYKMEGLDKNWIYLKTNRKVYFTELSPGTYTFKVKASNNSGIWNGQETTLKIEVRPPWWLSGWAYFGYVLATILLIYYLARSYHNKTEEKNRRKIEYLEIAKEKEIFKAKIEFFTNVAHEIRTPLTLIKGPLEKVIRVTSEVNGVKDSLKIMERNTDRLIDLSNQLLDFRQTEIGGFSLNFVHTDLSELLEETYLNFKPLAEQKRLEYQIMMPTQRVFAYVDVEAFTKILTNLFSNAVKYADSCVFVYLLPAENEENYVTIEIKNDGFLVPADMKEKIFEPFFRLKETEKQKGTGIGLALSRSLAELHNGILGTRDSKDGLNIFYLSIPVKNNA